MVKTVKKGDLVEVSVPGYKAKYKCLITSVRDGVTGRMCHVNKNKQYVKEDYLFMYFEKKDLENMKRLKVSQVPKKLAEKRRKMLQ